MSDKREPAEPIYTPESPDALRDGLYAGFWAHQKPPATKGKPA